MRWDSRLRPCSPKTICRSAKPRPSGSLSSSAAGPRASRSPTSPAAASSGASNSLLTGLRWCRGPRPRPLSRRCWRAPRSSRPVRACWIWARARAACWSPSSAELPDAVGLGVDINAAAISLARANARRHGLDGRASFVVADWGAPLAARFDIVVSNPPYVATAAFASLAPEIVCHEPQSALVGGADGYACYRQLAPQIARLLAPAGLAAIELGAEMADEIASLFAAMGLAEIDRRRDLAGTDRCALFVHGAGAGL